MSDPRFLAVEGPIGVGKTTLARRLAATLDAQLLLEPTFENPFLERFYRDRHRFALPTQLSFLLKRVELMARVNDDLLSTRCVADFVLDKDRLFAEAVLSPDELVLYQSLHDQLAASHVRPDLIIYLQAPPRVLHERIRARGIAIEQRITTGYLETLCEAYARLFHFYDGSPVLIVNASEIDLAHEERHYLALLDRMRSMRAPREYYNPQASLL